MAISHIVIISIVLIVVLISGYLPNVHATCVIGPSGTTLCAGMSQTPSIQKSASSSNIPYGKNPDVIITANCALNDIKYGDYYNTCYQPTTLYVKLGTKVIWKNDDIWQHTVTYGNPWNEISQGYFFDSKALDPGDGFSYQFNHEGAYPYFDGFNWWETGLVIVKK